MVLGRGELLGEVCGRSTGVIIVARHTVFIQVQRKRVPNAYTATMLSRLRRLLTCLFVMLAVTTQGIAGAAMATQMAGPVSPSTAHASPGCDHTTIVKVSDHVHHAQPLPKSHQQVLSSHSCEASHAIHVTCAACLMVCSGLSLTATPTGFTDEQPRCAAPVWIAQQIPRPALGGLLRPPLRPLA